MDERGRHQNDLREDVDVVGEYGKRFPETWTGLKLDGTRLVVLFTDPDTHRAEIAALVAHPDRVDVRAAKRSAREVHAILSAVASRLKSSGGRWFSFGPHLDVVTAELHGNAEDIARELHERFGDAVELTVGAHRYPFPDPPPAAAALPAPQSTMQIGAAGLRAIPDSSVVAVGGSVDGHVEITNTTTDQQLQFETDQPLLGQLLDGDLVVSATLTAVAGTGLLISLAAGERSAIPFFVETNSLDLRSGPTLPPGRYQLVVTVPIHSLAGACLQDQQFVSAPIPIDIVAPDGVAWLVNIARPEST